MIFFSIDTQTPISCRFFTSLSFCAQKSQICSCLISFALDLGSQFQPAPGVVAGPLLRCSLAVYEGYLENGVRHVN